MLRFKQRTPPTSRQELTASQRRFQRIYLNAVRQVQDQIKRDEGLILDAIQHRSLQYVVDLVNDEPWYQAQELMQQELLSELIDGGKRTKLPSIQKAELRFKFDAARPEAASWASKEAGALIREVTQDQINVVRDLASRASMGEFTGVQTARSLRDHIGLTQRQSGWVDNFRQRTFAEQIGQGRSLSDALTRTDSLTDKYSDRIHRYRSEMIARTEILRASHEGRRQAWGQGIQEGYISPNDRKYWSANDDDRICEDCSSMSVKYDQSNAIFIGEEFEMGEPPIHPMCRCDIVLAPAAPDADLADLSQEQIDEMLAELLSPATTTPTSMPYALDPQIVRKGFSEQVGRRSNAIKNQIEGDITRSFQQVSQQEVRVRVPTNAMGSILDEGRMRNAYELSDDLKYMSQRQNIEQSFIGVPSNAAAAERPIYGVINNYARADRYGDVSIVLKDEVKSRTSVSVGDSFNGVNPVPVSKIAQGTATSDDLARAVSDFDWQDISRGQSSLLDATKGQYWEAQIHGGVNLKDISRIEAPRGWVENLSPSQLAALERSGIDVVIT